VLWEPKLFVGLFNRIQLSLDLWVDRVNQMLVEVPRLRLILTNWVRIQNLQKFRWRNLRNEFHRSESVVRPHIVVKSSDITQKFLKLILSHSIIHSMIFKHRDILLLKVRLKEQKQRRCLIGYLVEHHFGPGPWGLTHVMGVLLLLVTQLTPSLRDILQSSIGVSMDELRQVWFIFLSWILCIICTGFYQIFRMNCLSFDLIW